MHVKSFYPRIHFRFPRMLARRWNSARLSWYVADKEPWLFALATGLIIAALGIALHAVFTHKDERRDLAREEVKRNLTCLARNVYFEARGEPTAGQLAVAQVTMNRKASGRFADSVCGVVYQQNWDPLRKRYVGAFSWTELNALPEPTDKEWQRAWKVAEAVYYGREPSALEGALYFHANYVKPDWAKEKQLVARIGKHVFYR